MYEFIKNGLALFGGCVVIIFAYLVILMFWEWIRDQIDMAVYRRKRKHRFDKKPIAECYCKDCVQYTSYDEQCHKFHQFVRDNNFCCWGNPHKRDPEKKKK